MSGVRYQWSVCLTADHFIAERSKFGVTRHLGIASRGFYRAVGLALEPCRGRVPLAGAGSFFITVNQVLVRLWARASGVCLRTGCCSRCPIVCLTGNCPLRRGRPSGRRRVFRGVCKIVSDGRSIRCDRVVTPASNGGRGESVFPGSFPSWGWFLCMVDRTPRDPVRATWRNTRVVSSIRRAFGGCLGTRRR